jgi:hypothetical protein
MTCSRMREIFYWQKGYGAFTVSAVVSRYIADHERRHEKRSFRDEFVEMSRAKDIDLDGWFSRS